jgi:hypothetical protein
VLKHSSNRLAKPGCQTANQEREWIKWVLCYAEPFATVQPSFDKWPHQQCQRNYCRQMAPFFGYIVEVSSKLAIVTILPIVVNGPFGKPK